MVRVERVGNQRRVLLEVLRERWQLAVPRDAKEAVSRVSEAVRNEDTKPSPFLAFHSLRMEAEAHTQPTVRHTREQTKRKEMKRKEMKHTSKWFSKAVRSIRMADRRCTGETADGTSNAIKSLELINGRSVQLGSVCLSWR